MRTTCIILVLLVLTKCLVVSQESDSCLKFLIVEGQAEANIDSIRVDSCSGSPSFGRMFARDRFVFGFAKRLMNLPSRDSVHLFATIADIDTTQRALIDSLYALQNRIGMLRFYSRNVIDTLANGEQVIVLRTVTFHEPDTIIAILKNLPQSLGASFQPRMNLKSLLPNDKGLDPRSLAPACSTSAYYRPNHFHKRSWHWSHYSMKVPLAWEITMGASSSYISAYEGTDGAYNNDPELTNFRKLVQSPAQQYEKFRGSGDASYDLGYGHGQNTMSSAIAAANNGHPIVGICPNCSGLLGEANYDNNGTLVSDMEAYDTDGNAQNSMTPPVSNYNCNGIDVHDPIRLISNGIVTLGATNNVIGTRTISGTTYCYPRDPVFSYTNGLWHTIRNTTKYFFKTTTSFL